MGHGPRVTERTSTAPPSLPPSEPRPSSRPRFDLGERPLRAQLVAALVLGLAVVSIPLYLWRRPKTEAEPSRDKAPVASSSVDVKAATALLPLDTKAAPRAPSLSEMRVLSCGDAKRGKGESRAERASLQSTSCDRPDGFDKLFAKAIADSASCVPEGNGGSIAYRADLGFSRKKNPIHVSAPKDGRSLKSGKIASACLHEIRKKLDGTALDMRHDHPRYRLEIVATYPGAVK
jgi:hypothetical protein